MKNTDKEVREVVDNLDVETELIKNIYIKDYHGFRNLRADIRYKPYDDENDSVLIIDRLFIRHQYSMGVGSDEDISSLINTHESIKDELTEILIGLLES